MLDFTNIDAIQFVQDSQSNIRVYYQNDDRTIRESCFNNQQKWFTRGDIVTTEAKANSPIVATRWNNGQEIQIRLYYINSVGKICERVGTSQTGGTTIWTNGGDLTAASVATASQLGIARPGKDASILSVYYQEAKTNKIREITYWDDQQNWSVSDNPLAEALEGTRISAVSAKPFGDVRLYFQGTDNNLKEWFMKQEDVGPQWSITNLRAFPLAPKTPIAAICWFGNTSNPDQPKDLRIRIFTVTKAMPGALSQLVYNQNQGWNANPANVTSVYTAVPNISEVGICQIPGNNTGAISVFFQPESKVIDLKPVPMSGGPAGVAEAGAVVLPRGIPKYG